MSEGKRSTPTGARLGTVFYQLVKELRAFILKHEVSYEEYHQALEFFAEAGAAGELPLLLDVFLETMVDEVNNGRKPGTASCLEGPYYVPGAPLLQRPYALPQRENEPGETLLLSVRSDPHAGSPLPESCSICGRQTLPASIRNSTIGSLDTTSAGACRRTSKVTSRFER